ncbi:SRPBCC domain-containing protein [Nonomuraea sp. MG754425]|uniref:SRPBCC family protein n=1 Tax=Nonomuraea sp. MG754425 TaxID=2570319 RepID=UPI001F297F61|nr:SRPBCC family protein [Nonomuraea sp. MG754425]MCF6472287.1 SRPBCC domain-containing protein [Nonomuraea sp. MG754425]
MTEPMILRARIPAPAERVRRALSDPADLRVWLAEQVDAEVPERFGFWGRTTPEGDAPHQRLLHADERTLRFAWLLDGEETVSELSVAPDGDDATILTLSQTHFDFQDTVTGKSIRGVLQTYWCQVLTRLAEHLEGRALTPMQDYTSTDMRVEVEIDAPVPKVFHSITDSEAVTRWFGYPIEIEPYEGGRFAMGGFDANPNPSKVLEVVPDRRFVVDWGDAGVGTWELEGSGGRTRLTLVQSGFDEATPPYAGWGGFLSGVAELRRFLEVPDWKPVIMA